MCERSNVRAPHSDQFLPRHIFCIIQFASCHITSSGVSDGISGGLDAITAHAQRPIAYGIENKLTRAHSSDYWSGGLHKIHLTVGITADAIVIREISQCGGYILGGAGCASGPHICADRGSVRCAQAMINRIREEYLPRCAQPDTICLVKLCGGRRVVTKSAGATADDCGHRPAD